MQIYVEESVPFNICISRVFSKKLNVPCLRLHIFFIRELKLEIKTTTTNAAFEPSPSERQAGRT